MYNVPINCSLQKDIVTFSLILPYLFFLSVTILLLSHMKVILSFVCLSRPFLVICSFYFLICSLLLFLSQFEQTRQQLLESLIKEEIGHVQRKIANTVATHAKLTSWPALMQGIIELSSSTNYKHHDLALFLLDKLAENIGTVLLNNIDLVFNIIIPFLSETNNLQTRILGAQAFCSVLHEIPLGNTILHNALQLLPPIIISAINNSDDLLLQDLLSSICRLVKEKTEFFILSWESLFSCIQTLCESADLDNGTQVIGLEIIVILLTNKKSSFCSTIKSRKDCLHLCMKLMIVVDEDDVSIFSRTRPISEGEIIYSVNCMRKLIHCCYLYLVLYILKILNDLNYRFE